MKLSYLLVLVLFFFYFYFNGPYFIAWIIGILILLIVISNLFSSTTGIAKATGKELLRDVESDMEKANPTTPNKEYLKEIIKETGRKTGEALAPENYTYKNKNLWEKIGQGTKNFFNGLKKIFE